MLSNCLVSCLQEEVEPFPEERENFLQQLYKFMEDRGERGGDEIDVLFLGFFLFIYVVLITPFTFFWSYKYFFTLFISNMFTRAAALSDLDYVLLMLLYIDSFTLYCFDSGAVITSTFR